MRRFIISKLLYKPVTRCGIAGLLMIISVCTANANVTFEFTFDDVINHTGIGFDDPLYGAMRRTVLSDFINGTVGAALNHNATVKFEVNNSLNSSTSGILAAAGSYFFSAPNTLQGGIVYTNILTGTDYNPGGYAGSMTWNFGVDWALNANPVGGQFDFRTAALHEITHALGFLSLIDATGASTLAPNAYSYFDYYLVNSAGTPLIAGDAYFNSGAPPVYTGNVSDLTSGVFFAGPNATALYGGPVPLFSPATFMDGSSLSHWDENSSLSSLLMSYSLAPGEIIRTWSPLEQAVLSDLGYSIVAVPEPAVSAIFVALLAIGVVWSKRRISLR